METAGELDDKAWIRVVTIMMISSTPYIFFRPIQSAMTPNPTWPTTVPQEVATLMAVSSWLEILPLK